MTWQNALMGGTAWLFAALVTGSFIGRRLKDRAPQPPPSPEPPEPLAAGLPPAGVTVYRCGCIGCQRHEAARAGRRRRDAEHAAWARRMNEEWEGSES
jgi:hypothetical protein